MKSLIVATVLSASFAFAGTVVSHNYSEVLQGIELKNACLTADTVRTIHPVRTCATALKSRTVGHGGEEGQYTEWYCPRFQTANLEFSRSFERTVCTDLRRVGNGEGEMLECKAYGKKAEFLPEVISVQVWEELGEVSTWPGKTRSFRFPACN